MKNLIFSLVFVGLLLILPELTYAQCSMCKAVVESGADNELMEGVNSGILYMMGVPYILMFVVGLVWYKKYFRSKT